jgi:hypothetical protein
MTNHVHLLATPSAAGAAYFYPYFYAYATVEMRTSLQQNLQDVTAHRSVCPAE